MISFLIMVLVGLLIVLVLCWVIQQLPLPANVQKVAMAIVALIFLLWILERMGFGATVQAQTFHDDAPQGLGYPQPAGPRAFGAAPQWRFKLAAGFDVPTLSPSQELEAFRRFEAYTEKVCGVDIVLVTSGQHITIATRNTCYQSGGKTLCNLGEWHANSRMIAIQNTTPRWTRYGDSAVSVLAACLGHEWGHALGWGHSSSLADLMNSNLAVTEWSANEAAALVRGYGPPRPLDVAGTWKIPAANASFVYGDGSYIALVGIFDGRNWGACLYHPPTSAFMVRHSLTAGLPDVTFVFGPPNSGFQPLCGDWDFDGRWTVGLYDPRTSRFLLKNTLSGGRADQDFIYGSPQSQAIGGLLGTYTTRAK